MTFPAPWGPCGFLSQGGLSQGALSQGGLGATGAARGAAAPTVALAGAVELSATMADTHRRRTAKIASNFILRQTTNECCGFGHGRAFYGISPFISVSRSKESRVVKFMGIVGVY